MYFFHLHFYVFSYLISYGLRRVGMFFVKSEFYFALFFTSAFTRVFLWRFHGSLILSSIMTGIENTQGSQHCYFNALLQCFSVNQTLFKELERHNVNHIIDQGKLTFRVSLLCKTSIRFSLSIAKLDLSLHLENS